MKIKEITNYLESLAPLNTQESYDNSGLIVGNGDAEIEKVLISLDCLESTVDEAIQEKAGLIIAHHPILFKKIKTLTGKNYVERVLIKAIKNDIAIYAIHTNLDNYSDGVNKEIADRLGVKNPKILRSMPEQLVKLVVFVPQTHHQAVADSMFSAGAGHIGVYDSCSFSSPGKGSFRALDGADPYVGEKGKIHYEDEVKLEVIVEKHRLSSVLRNMKNSHPYEEVAYDIFALENQLHTRGAGMIGNLEKEVDVKDFLTGVKKNFDVKVIRHTELTKKKIKKVAWCGGAGFFLLNDAIKSGADLFITSDVKYHEFFDADNEIILADIGHYESEQFTIQRINELLKKKFPTFALRLTKLNTNPINYL